ncbi:MAG: alpha-amylase family glycosyl hydrolase, partial [Acutalibacteraceae bacterium]
MKTTKKMLSVLLCIGVLLSMMVFVPANAVMTDVNSSGDLTLSESYVYLINTNNWSSPMCYAWKTNGGNNGAWPGVSMTQVGTYNGYSVYGAEVSTEYDNCIFSNGSSGANQTANLTTQRGKAYNPAIPDWVSVSGGSSEEASTGSGTGGNSGTNTGDGSSFSKSVNAEDFSWDNASVYFLLTDRFKDGNSSNNYSYDRLIGGNGSVTTKMTSDAGSFQGGDFAGIEDAIEEGYFDKLGVNALWISAPYEQIQGYVCSGNGKSSFPHYAYHGYYAGDYSEFDQNFGTAEEFESMVDTAHSHGIRIVLDVVMNHPGYNSMYDMNKFGFGYLKSGWEYEYYSFAGNNNTYHNYITYTDAANTAAINAAWASWWGHDWLRAGISGYTGQGSDDLTGSAGGDLPDFKTESTKTVDVPEFLQNKWKQEGTYTTKINEINSYFSSTGKSKTVRNFLVYWLSQYVEQFGVDGFRCDTAKHVEKASWAALKDGCVEALNKWRANNPDKPGADWD